MKNLLLTLLVTLSVTLSVPAQTFISGNSTASGGPNPANFLGQGVTNAAAPGANFVSNKVWFVVPAASFSFPRIDHLLATSDLIPASEGNIQFYFSTNSCAVTNAGISGTNQLWLDTTGLASNDVVVLRSITGNNYQRLMITNMSASMIMVHPTAAFATGIGDIVYKETAGPSMNLSGATNYCFMPSAAAGVAPINVYGRIGQPLLFDMSFSNAANFKLVSGTYLQNRDR